MNGLDGALTRLLREKGADLVGFADLHTFHATSEMGMPFGISVAVTIPAEIIGSIYDGPNIEYFEIYHRCNKLLNSLVSLGAAYLTERGYRAYAQTTDAVKQSKDYRTALPHKTVATRAGIGWIGKCALLVTEEYGSAIRISSLITDAVLQCVVPISDSCCGSCIECVENCPGGAVSGEQWTAGMDREYLFDAFKCSETARALSAVRIGREATLCGKCIVSCPYTQRYLSRRGLRKI